MRTKKKKLTVYLPSTPCTPEMRQAMVDVVTKRGQSLAEAQREAFSIFLEKYGSKTIVSGS
jgi:hypothetical protein